MRLCVNNYAPPPFFFFFSQVCNKEQPSGRKRVLEAKTEGLWYFLAVLSASQTICMTVGSPMGHRFPLFTMGIVILNWVKTP